MKYKVFSVEEKESRGMNNDAVFSKKFWVRDEQEMEHGPVFIRRFPNNGVQYSQIQENAVVDGTVSPNEKGYLTFSFPRAYAKKDRDYAGEERRRNMRINWWASLNNAVQAAGHMKDREDKSYWKTVFDVQEKIMSKFADYDKNIK